MAKRFTQRSTLAAVLAFASAACVSSTEIPSLAGPSELALSFALTATPDTISHDGFSQSAIMLTARDINGKALAGQVFRLDMLVNGVAVNYGTLSGRTVVTASDGKATVVYTSPPAPPFGAIVGSCSPSVFSPVLPGGCVTIAATPISNGFLAGTNSQTVDIHLVPVELIIAPGSPNPSFVFSPSNPTVNQEIFFNASGSSAAAGRKLVSYSWNWGDGTTGNGVVEDHDYVAPGPYFVILTVTDDAGNKASIAKTVTVS